MKQLQGLRSGNPILPIAPFFKRYLAIYQTRPEILTLQFSVAFEMKYVSK